jgi:hypothetical protein
VTVLWDITYVLEIVHRISLGEIPYRDFVVPQGPVTFVIQAIVHRAFGAGVQPHFIAAAVVAGLTLALTFYVVGRQLDGIEAPLAAFLALAVTVPAVFLNGYAILPLPFYDPDCVFFVLLAIAAVLWARNGTAAWRHAAAGALIVVPVFVKQNIGLAAFAALHLLLAVSALRHPEERRGCAATAAGSLLALAAALGAIHLTAGLAAWYHWTVTYAASRRWPSAGLVLSVYARPRTWAAIAGALAGYLVVRRARGRAGVLVGLALVALPWADALRTMFRWGFASRSYALWGVGTAAAAAAWFTAARSRDWRFERAVPLAAIAIAHGAFASQGVHDSSYGVWPLLFVALAPGAAAIVLAAPPAHRRLAAVLIAASAVVLLAFGYRHVTSHERLGFANLAGPVEHASHPRLRGLAAPGTHLSDFEQVLRRTDVLIPRDAPVLVMPGEDPFYYASGRRPPLAAVLFDDTAAPYDRQELVRLLDAHGVEWVVLKTRLQLHHSPWRHLEAFVRIDLPARFVPVDELPGYRIYRRR